jgi:hypothetical protein
VIYSLADTHNSIRRYSGADTHNIIEGYSGAYSDEYQEILPERYRYQYPGDTLEILKQVSLQ